MHEINCLQLATRCICMQYWIVYLHLQGLKHVHTSLWQLFWFSSISSLLCFRLTTVLVPSKLQAKTKYTSRQTITYLRGNTKVCIHNYHPCTRSQSIGLVLYRRTCQTVWKKNQKETDEWPQPHMKKYGPNHIHVNTHNCHQAALYTLTLLSTERMNASSSCKMEHLLGCKWHFQFS